MHWSWNTPSYALQLKYLDQVEPLVPHVCHNLSQQRSILGTNCTYLMLRTRITTQHNQNIIYAFSGLNSELRRFHCNWTDSITPSHLYPVRLRAIVCVTSLVATVHLMYKFYMYDLKPCITRQHTQNIIYFLSCLTIDLRNCS